MRIMKCGADAAAVLTPIIVSMLALSLGWRTTFWVTSAAGFMWVVLWFALIRRRVKPPRELSRQSADVIEIEARSVSKRGASQSSVE